MDLDTRAARVECLLCDVDGTLTDGLVTIGNSNVRNRSFSIRDGLGIRLWKGAGFSFGVITGDDSEASIERASMLRADFQYFGCFDKRGAIQDIIKKSAFDASQIAFVGDDLIDIPVFREVGFSVAVNDASADLDGIVHYRTEAPGGRGAVREVIEMILRAKGLWKGILEGFINLEK